MKTIRLPETRATRLHIECLCEDGTRYCIETDRHCGSVQVPDDVENFRITECDGMAMRMKQQAEFMVIR